MTEEELREATSPQGDVTLIMHENMKDVAFWPLSIQITSTHYELNGIWYSNTFQGFFSGNGVDPARETIKIKKEELSKWKKKERKA